jgi:hypothetical protein
MREGVDREAINMRYYYQPGLWYRSDDEVYWDDYVTSRRREAVRRARALARERGGSPIYGYWYQAHGPSPGADVVIDVVEV